MVPSRSASARSAAPATSPVPTPACGSSWRTPDRMALGCLTWRGAFVPRLAEAAPRLSPLPLRLIDMARLLTLADFGRRAGGEPIVLRNTKQRVAEHGSDEVADGFEIWAATGANLGDQINYRDTSEADRLRKQMDRINAALDEADLCLDTAA